MPDKLTDNEIVKAFECCYTDKLCEECPLCELAHSEKLCFNGDAYAIPRMIIDLINRLQAENEELVRNTNKLKAEIERLQKANGLFEYLKNTVHYNDGLIREFRTIEDRDEAINKMVKKFSDLQTAKAEAYKEFAVRLKHKAINIGVNDSIVSTYAIDNLLKEMADDSNSECVMRNSELERSDNNAE